MCWVYVIKSLKDGKLYIGSTRFDVNKRLQIHNRGSVRWTKSHRPWKLVYKEKFPNYTQARKRELFLKTGVGRKELQGILRAGTQVDKGGRL